MGHKLENENTQVKTYSFKVKNCTSHSVESMTEIIKDYQTSYNAFSDWICSHLLDTKIGDLAVYFDKKDNFPVYYERAISDEWKDKPLYHIFSKRFGGTHRNNLLYLVVQKLNIGNYSTNKLGLSETYYSRQGFVQAVISNYVSKFSSFTLKGVKFRNLPEVPTEEELLTQCLCDITKYNLNTKADWEETITYLTNKGVEFEKRLSRTKILFDYYKKNENFIRTQQEEMAVKELISFGGCHRRDDKLAMTIQFSSSATYKVEMNSSMNGYTISAPRNIFSFDVFGRHDTVLNGEILVDVENKHCDSITIKIVKGEMYIDVPVDVDFVKTENNGEVSVGIDINTKHMLMMASLKDNGSLKNYVNIYKELVNDDEFVKLCPIETLKQFKDFAQYVTFAPIEYEFLVSRNCATYGWEDFDKYSSLEMAYSNVLRKLQAKFIKAGDTKNRIYIENILKLRSQINSHARLKNKYYQEQGIFDKEQNYVDDFSENNIKMDNRRNENPFVNTIIAQELLQKMRRIEDTVVGCVLNIVVYAYKIFENNNINVICLEKLQSSQLEKIKIMPSIPSLMKYHKVEGHTIDDLEKMEIYNVIKKGYYDFEFDEDKRIVGCKLSGKGEFYKFKQDFFNQMIKCLHFASIKDYFILLQNNGNVNIALVPNQYTSQMDSVNHVLYTELSKNGKEVLVNKNKVRKTQEYHINGLNADYNAAKNINYTFENNLWRETLLNKNELKYRTPLWDTKIKTQGGVITKLKSRKINAFKSFNDVFLNEKTASKVMVYS